MKFCSTTFVADCRLDFDILAQDFTGDISSYKDSGRFGHSAVVRDGTTLVITGGFRGMVTNDIIAMKMPGTVAVNPLTSGENRTAEDQCLYHKSHSVCQQDPSCAHCDSTNGSNDIIAMKMPGTVAVNPLTSGENRTAEDQCLYHKSHSVCQQDPSCAHCDSTNGCINRKYAQDCTGDVKYGFCPGVCSQALTCHACLSLDKDTEGSGVKGQCGWCVQERTCYSISEAHTRCGDTSSAGWWGDTMTLIEDFSQCVLEDFPPGMILTTHHVPANREFPDKVEIVNVTHQELSRNYDYIPNVSGERGLWSLTGVLHPLSAAPSKQSSRLQVFVTSKNIQTKLVMSTDMTASLAETVALFNSTDMKTVEAFRPLNSTLIPDRSLEYYMRLEGLWLSETDKSYILGLSWNGDAIDRDDIAARYLRPYTSGNCNIHWNCNSCLTDALCGWCPLSQTCEIRNDTALPPERCGAFAGTLRHHLTIDSAYCQDCNLFTDCVSCVEGPHCEWFQKDKTTLCLRRGSLPEAINSSSECGLSCYGRTSCKECTELDSCAWCAEDNKCFPFKHYIKTYSYGQCSHWFDQPSHCPNCRAYTNCQNCLENFQCGWCGNTINPLNGTCVLGDFAGPMADQNCSALVGEIYNLPLNEAADWSYETCPDVEEYKLGLYKCHENASCLNTYKSYECKCNQGYKGDGTSSCVRTCFHECIHGVCSEAPLFECDCDLGWTGLNCSTDCGCTFHSSCSQGVGFCDYCHYNTMGERCDQCSPGSYGDPLRPEGCEQCDCNEHGDPEKGYCNESTQECFCMDNTMGDHCEECQPGFYGDPRHSVCQQDPSCAHCDSTNEKQEVCPDSLTNYHQSCSEV
ncbi:Multiple epidermal growth factor-like domains protein 8 [Holothuria leucospilota]|uniref:Multiple epidermal growth factor-like domains protein 8 n=1 Tax=Holothuria leucospilota TaxID=206669 RepID=A0A9Q1BXD1_HOLLE|nr:Multiple epidermal growth factor-like domains protein 8 [Holothuria leucospilota]